MVEPQDTEKNLGGRPPKFATPEEMQIAIDAYFAECDPHIVTYQYYKVDKRGRQFLKTEKRISKQVPYTMSGLSYALGMSRWALIKYKRKDEFVATIKEARRRVERFVEEGMLSSSGVVAGHIFNLKNNFGWHDKQEVDHTTKGKEIQQPQIVSDIAPRTTQDAPAQTEAT